MLSSVFGPVSSVLARCSVSDMLPLTMTSVDLLLMTKYAGGLEQVAAKVPGAPSLGWKLLGASALGGTLATPFSTYKRMQDGEGARGFGAGAMTDLGRGVGGIFGITALKGLERNFGAPESAAARAALTLASIATGSALGHFRGKELGEHLFHPGTRMERFQRALNAY